MIICCILYPLTRPWNSGHKAKYATKVDIWANRNTSAKTANMQDTLMLCFYIAKLSETRIKWRNIHIQHL